MRFSPGGVMRKAAKKTGKLVSPGGVMKRPAAKKAKPKAKKKTPVKPKRPLRVNPGGVMRRPMPAPRPSPATG